MDPAAPDAPYTPPESPPPVNSADASQPSVGAPAALVYLNVGGVVFTTRRSTLLDSQSFFSGAVRANPECTELFVDRDPTFFRHVLNWMRGVRFLPEEECVLRELLFEADYFAMTDMHQAIVRSRRYSIGRSLETIGNEVRNIANERSR